MIRRSLAVLFLPVLLAACAGREDVLKPSPLPDFEPGVRIEVLWRDGAGGEEPVAGARLAPAVTGNRVYALDARGRVSAWDRHSGKRLWRKDSGMRWSSGPVAAYDRLFAGTREGELVALDAEDGSVLWKTGASGELLAPPVVDEGQVIARNAAGRLIAVDRQTGEVRWTRDDGAPLLALRASSRPLVVADAVLAGLPGGMLVAVSREDGRLLWERRIAEPEGASELDRIVDIAGDFVTTGDRLYVATFQGRLVALDLRNGQIRWQQPLSTHRGLALAGDAVLAVDAQSGVAAFRAADGVLLWRQDALKGRDLTGVAVSGDYLLAGDLDGHVHVMDRTDGRIVGRKRLARDALMVAPVVDDGIVFLQSRNGRVAAWRVEPR